MALKYKGGSGGWGDGEGGGGGRSPPAPFPADWLDACLSFISESPGQDQVSSNGGRSGCVSGTCDILETSGGGQQHHMTEQRASHDRTASTHTGSSRTQGPDV